MQRKLLLSSVLATMLVGGLQAGQIYIENSVVNAANNTQGNQIYTATEGLAITSGSNFDLDPAIATPMGNNVGRAIVYVPGIAFNAGDKITFNLTNAKFMDSTYYLMVDESVANIDINNDNDLHDVVEVGQVISTTDTTNGVGSITLRITVDGVTADTPAVLTSSNNQAADDSLTDQVLNDSDNPKIKIDSGLGNGSTVTVSVNNAEDVGGTSLTGADASDTTLIEVKDQFVISFRKGTSVIDAQNERKSFVEEGSPSDVYISSEDTDLTVSGGVITVNNDSLSIIDDHVTDTTVGNGSLDLSISGDTTGWTKVVFDDNSNVWNETSDGTDSNFDTTTWTLVGSGLIPLRGNEKSEDIAIEIDGVTPVDTQTIALSATVNLPGSYADIIKTENDFIVWDINGYKARIPKVTYAEEALDGNSIDTKISFTNRSNVSTGIEFTIYAEDGNICNVSFPSTTLPPNNSKEFFFSTDLLSNCPASFPSRGSFSVEVLIPTDKENIYGFASFKNKTLKQFKDLPIYDTTTSYNY